MKRARARGSLAVGTNRRFDGLYTGFYYCNVFERSHLENRSVSKINYAVTWTDRLSFPPLFIIPSHCVFYTPFFHPVEYTELIVHTSPGEDISFAALHTADLAAVSACISTRRCSLRSHRGCIDCFFDRDSPCALFLYSLPFRLVNSRG